MHKQYFALILALTMSFACSEKNNPETKESFKPASSINVPAETPAPMENSSPQASWQWKAGTIARDRAFQKLTFIYSNTQSANLFLQRREAHILCIFLLTLNNSAAHDSDFTPKLNSCANFSSALQGFLDSPIENGNSLSRISLDELPKFHLPMRPAFDKNRLPLASAQLSLSAAIAVAKNINNESDPRKLFLAAKQIEIFLAEAAPATLQLFAKISQHASTTPEFKDIYTEQLWKQVFKDEAAVIRKPWESPSTWEIALDNHSRIKPDTALDSLSNALKKNESSDAMILTLLTKPIINSEALLQPIQNLQQNSLATIREEFSRRTNERRNNLISIHATSATKAFRISKALDAIISLLQTINPNLSLRLHEFIHEATATHDLFEGLVHAELSPAAFLSHFAERLEHLLRISVAISDGSTFPKEMMNEELHALQSELNLIRDNMNIRFDSIDTALLTISKLMENSFNTSNARLLEIQTQLRELSTSLNLNNQIILDGFQSVLRQPFELSHEKCLGPSSLLARLGTVPSDDEIGDCLSSFSTRASKLSIDSLLTGNLLADSNPITAFRQPAEFLYGWLNQELNLSEAGAIANPAEWSKGISDYYLYSLATASASSDFFESGTIETVGRNTAGLFAKIAESKVLASVWNDYQLALQNFQNASAPTIQNFNTQYFHGLNSDGYPELIMARGELNSLYLVALNLGIVQKNLHQQELLFSTNGSTPHAYNSFSMPMAAIKVVLDEEAVLTDGSNKNLGVGRQFTMLWQCPYIPPACGNKPMNSSCDTNAYYQFYVGCRAEALTHIDQLKQNKISTDDMDKVLAPLIRNKILNPSTAFASFMAQSPEFKKIRTALEKLMRQYALLQTTLRIAYSDALESEDAFAKLFVGKDALPDLPQMNQALSDFDSMKSILKLSLESRLPETNAAIKSVYPNIPPALARGLIIQSVGKEILNRR